MAEPGDIIDSFDDNELRKSIEAADKDGKWKDATARFEDPKLQSLARQLAEAPRANYTERRLAELDRRAAQRIAAEAARGKANKPKGAFEEASGTIVDKIAPDWRKTVGKPDALPPPPPPPVAPPEPERPAENTALQAAMALAAAFLVFGVAAGVQGTIGGFSTDLVLRAAAAATVTGIGWHFFGTGRFRCAGIGTGAYLVAFVSTCDISERMQLFATFLGALVALLGSGAAGITREENTSPTPRRAK